MIDLLRRNPWVGALALVAAFLAAVVAFELTGAIASTKRSASSRAPAAIEAKLLPPVAPMSEQSYSETAARPLWVPTRRPAPAVVAAPATFARGQYILQGVTIAGETRIALLKEKASGRMHRVEKGRDLNGIQVAEIEPERVTLAQGAEVEVLDLRVQRPGASPGSVPPPAPSAGSQGPFPAPSASSRGAPAAGSPVLGQPVVPAGPLPTGASTPTSIAAPSNASAPAVPQGANPAPMSPEELLARRRARRSQSPQ